MRKYYRVQAEINLDAVRNNIIKNKALLTENTKLLAVVKADGYGHGAVELAKNINDIVDAYGVAILEEGIELREAGIKKPILILGYTASPQYEDMIKYDIDTALFTLEMAEEMSRVAMSLGKPARVHLKLDTGMSRIGFSISDESLEKIKRISKLPGIVIDGCFSHFARMDEVDKSGANKQFEKFVSFTRRIEDEGIELPIKHISNSAGIIERPDVNLDMVRLGISLYGLYPSDEVDKKKIELEPAMELKAYVSYVKKLPAGVEIGYGGTYTTSKETVVATIPVGYADGYFRSLSNKGCVLIKGKRAPIIGRICMDQFMVDVTDIEDVKTGDVAVLFGKDGDEFLSVEEISALAGSFNYEFVCDMGKRIPRVYLKNGKVVDTCDYYPE